MLFIKGKKELSSLSVSLDLSIQDILSGSGPILGGRNL